MKREQKSGTESFEKNHREKKAARPRNKEDERKEGLVLLMIAFLFLANVVLYLCHHYGLTSQNDLGGKPAVSARVMVD